MIRRLPLSRGTANTSPQSPALGSYHINTESWQLKGSCSPLLLFNRWRNWGLGGQATQRNIRIKVFCSPKHCIVSYSRIHLNTRRNRLPCLQFLFAISLTSFRQTNTIWVLVSSFFIFLFESYFLPESGKLCSFFSYWVTVVLKFWSQSKRQFYFGAYRANSVLLGF